MMKIFIHFYDSNVLKFLRDTLAKAKLNTLFKENNSHNVSALQMLQIFD